MSKIMILGAGRGQIGLFRAASRLGFETVAVTPKGDYPGLKLADQALYADIKDTEAVAAFAENEDVCGIVTAGMDAGLSAIGETCDRCGLAGFSRQSAEMSSNKLLMKEAFEKYGVRTARFRRISSEEELDRIPDEMQLPLITKAVDLGGSRGINIVLNEGQLKDAFHDTMAATRQDYCIIEEYIDGYECSATAFVCDGDVRFVLPTGDLRYGENDEIPIGHYVPFEGPEEVLRQIREQVELAIQAIGLGTCAVNADLMIRDGQVYVLELAGRLGANCIPELTSLYYGIDIYDRKNPGGTVRIRHRGLRAVRPAEGEGRAQADEHLPVPDEETPREEGGGSGKRWGYCGRCESRRQ